MTRATRLWFHASNLLVAGSGGVYAWTAYACSPDDPFALVNHPLQPHALHLHVLSAPLLVLMIGMLWQSHALPRYRGGETASRATGVVLLVNALPMIASGVLIQTAVSPGWRIAWVVVHLLASACWVVGSALHSLHTWVRIPRLRRTGSPPPAR